VVSPLVHCLLLGAALFTPVRIYKGHLSAGPRLFNCYFIRSTSICRVASIFNSFLSFDSFLVNQNWIRNIVVQGLFMNNFSVLFCRGNRAIAFIFENGSVNRIGRDVF
jgi:hypothetical protein